MNNTKPISYLASVADRLRSRRFRYRHSVPLAARELGIPQAWLWFWLCQGRIRAKKWVWGYWVRLEDVRKLLLDPESVYRAFEATGEPIRSQAAAELVLSKWRRLPKEIWHSPQLKAAEPLAEIELVEAA